LLKDKQVPYDDGNASVQAGLQKLALGRVSGLLVNPFNLGHDEVVLPRGERVEVAGPLILSKPYFLILSRAFQDANPGLARKLWAAVEQARQSAEFRRLYARQLDALQEGLALQP
jgi:polar amino acid transport system substrate-binding protein